MDDLAMYIVPIYGLIFLGEIISAIIGFLLCKNGFSFTKLLIALIPLICAVVISYAWAKKIDKEDIPDV